VVGDIRFEDEMTIHKVRLVKDGKLDGEYQNVTAQTQKEAAEKLHGGVLFKQGPASRMCAMVAPSSGPESPTLFYWR
jgi:hypothetical protein